MEILSTIVFWIFIAAIAVGGLAGIVMLGTGAKNLYRKNGSGTDVLLIILGLLITAAAAVAIVYLIAADFLLSAKMQQGAMYGSRV